MNGTNQEIFQPTIHKYAEDILIKCMKINLKGPDIKFEDKERQNQDECIKNFFASHLITGSSFGYYTQKLNESELGQFTSTED